MSGVLKRIRVWFSSVFSTETLLHEQKLLLFAMLFYFVAVGFSGVFINLLLYDATVKSAGLLPTDALLNIFRYNLYTYLFMLPLSCIIGIFGKRISAKNGMLAGLALHVVLFVVLLVAHTNVVKGIAWISLLSAMATSMFHVSYHETLGYAFAERSKRLFVTICSVLMTGAGIAAPLLAGLLIRYGKEMYGYSVAFSLALVFLAIACGFIVCIRLPARKKLRTYYASVLIESVKNKNILYANLAEAVRGMREGVITFLLPLLLYTVSGNAFVVGLYTAVCSVLQILSERHVQRNVNDKNRMGFMLFSVAVFILATTPFWFVYDVVSIFAYGIITALVVGFMSVPIAGIMHWTTSQQINYTNKQMECQCVRSLFLNSGKCIGMVLVIALYKIGMITLAIFLLNLILVGMWLLFSFVGEKTTPTPDYAAKLSEKEENLASEDESEADLNVD